MKEIVTGIFAHVDSGKTTLSEALLHESGSRRQFGRVDKGEAFLDPDELEKKRGITIFSHQAELRQGELKLTLLDTPGHIDFISQTESVMSVLDYAILIVAARSGVDAYTRMLWRLFARYHLPVFIFINKCDLGTDTATEIKALQKGLSPACVTFKDSGSGPWQEAVASADDTLLKHYLKSGSLGRGEVKQAIKKRRLFPVYYGSALKLQGIKEFLQGLEDWTQESSWPQKFQARIFKVSRDGTDRLSWLRVLGGTLQAKMKLTGGQKVDEIRLYDSDKFKTLRQANAGQVVAVTGIGDSYPGQGIGPSDIRPQIRPVMTFAASYGNQDAHAVLTALRELADENPELNVRWDERLHEITIQVMGEVELEVISQLLKDRFDLNVKFVRGRILYKETITKAVEAVGHFEPLRHYAEVHLLLRPAKLGSGIHIWSDCKQQNLSRTWQGQVLANLKKSDLRGVLLGAPLTDLDIVLVTGKSSLAHSMGGDFRKATLRGVRQGLMELRRQDACRILQPWYNFDLILPQNKLGRAVNDVRQMGGRDRPT